MSGHLIHGRASDHLRGRPSISFPSGRLCSHQGCATVLSVYNPSVFCALHEGTHPERFVPAPGNTAGSSPPGNQNSELARQKLAAS